LAEVTAKIVLNTIIPTIHTKTAA